MKSLAALVLLLNTNWFFQEPQPEPAKVEVKLPTKSGAPGATLKGKFLVTFSPGWHGYQNPPTREYEIPLKVETKTKGISLKVQYPKGEMKDFAGAQTAMYEGTVAVPFTLTLPKTQGVVSVKFEVNYQQCNSSTCLPPESLTVTEKLTVKKAIVKVADKRKP